MEDLFHLGIKGFIKNIENKILLLKVNPATLHKTNVEPYWDIPGGRMQKGQTVEETLKREIFEETGITNIQSFIPIGMVLSNIRIPLKDTDVGLILSIYECKVENIKSIKISEEHLNFNWFTPKECSELLKVKYPQEFTDLIINL